MNPTNHIKILLGILIIALTAFTVACGTAATGDSLTSGDTTVPTASVDIIEDSHESETIALDTHDDGDAHETEAIPLDTHDDGDAHDIKAIALDIHDDDHDAHDVEAIALDTHDDDHDAHDVEPMVMDMPDDGDDGEIVEISLNVVEGAAPWGFSPNLIEVPLGHRVMLTLNNGGRAEHDIEITNFDAEYVESMALMVHHDADGGHDETVVAAHPMPGTSASVMFTPTVAGEYEFHCTLPGHRELGMVGTIIVTDAGV